ncbi:MAG: hypothetical protein WCY05_01890 [Candidatus Omnitrophota bacterium]
MKDTKSATIVKEFLTKYPELPSLTLAKIIYKKNKLRWSSVDGVRNMIKYYRGQDGDRNRGKLADNTFVKPAGKLCPFDALPEPIKSLHDWKPYPVSGENILALFDLHIPFYAKPELGLVLKYAKKRVPDTIILGGDIIDFYSCSFWSTDPQVRNMLRDISQTLMILKCLRDSFPDTRIVFKVGNHEERLERYIRVKAADLIEGKAEDMPDDPIFKDIDIVKNFRKIIKADNLGIDVVENKRILKVGKHLHIIHGHEFGGGISVPVNPARTLFLRGKEIAMCGHFHQSSQHSVKTMGEKNIACWSVGCMCDLHPEYRPINEWNHGFAYIETSGDDFEVENKRIINMKIH